jgi:hypothetical protein
MGNLDEPFLAGAAADPAQGAPLERFRVLLLFSLLAMNQALAWNVFGPISSRVEQVYGWSDALIAWMANTANIAMLFSIPVSQRVASRMGTRFATVGCAGCMFVCSMLRVLPALFSMQRTGASVVALNLMSMFFNGVSAAWLNFAGPVISSQFFPCRERSTATAVGSVMCYVGVSLGYVFGPMAVPAPAPDSAADAASVGAALDGLLWAEALYSTAVLLLILALFPAAPSVAPSASAGAGGAGGGEGGGGAEAVTGLKTEAERVVAERAEAGAGDTATGAGDRNTSDSLLRLASTERNADSDAGSSGNPTSGSVYQTSPKALRLWAVVLAASLPLGVFR